MVSRCMASRIFPFGKYVQSNLPLLATAVSYQNDISQPVRYIKKHWNPKFKKLRREKVIKVELPDYQEEFTEEKRRSLMKERGIYPEKPYREHPLFVSCTPSIMEPYVPPEGDGKFSVVSTQGAKQKVDYVQHKTVSLMAIRKIKQYDDTFRTADFPQEALDIYIKAHETLAEKDTEKLRDYVTEVGYAKMLHNTENKIIRWKFLESLEPPRVVHVRCGRLILDENMFGQITVRFHSQQILAVYDRFGRLMQGSEILKKDVLEYVVFERHLANEYGVWRLHDKIVPPWMPPRALSERTTVLSNESLNKLKETEPSVVQTVNVEEASTQPK